MWLKVSRDRSWGRARGGSENTRSGGQAGERPGQQQGPEVGAGQSPACGPPLPRPTPRPAVSPDHALPNPSPAVCKNQPTSKESFVPRSRLPGLCCREARRPDSAPSRTEWPAVDDCLRRDLLAGQLPHASVGKTLALSLPGQPANSQF